MDIDIRDLLPKWAESDFAGRTKDELRAACRALELSITPNESIDTLTRKLLQHYGKFDQPTKSKAIKAPSTARLRTPPNLRSVIGWGGKKYRIRAMTQDESRGGSRKFPVLWEGEAFIVDPNQPYQDLPAPIYHNLRDAQSMDLTTKWDSQKALMEHRWTKYPRFPFETLGVTPGTEHLPESLRDWYIADARAHELYANEDKDSLERIWKALTDGSRPNKDDRDRNTAHWRYEVLHLLGLTPEQEELAA